MRLVLRVFDALQAAGEPRTRAEIEGSTGLTYDEVHKGLLGLKRRQALVILGGERRRAQYQLAPGAERPQDGRGHFPRTLTHRQRLSALRLAHLGRICFLPASYSPARPPTQNAKPGRVHASRSISACALAEAYGYFAPRKR